MKTKTTDVAIERDDEIANLRSSPLRGLKPIKPDPIDVPIELIEFDPSNPGIDTDKSLRYERRGDSIRDSFDILGGIVYPIVVCQKEDDAGRYILIDGHGRLFEIRDRGVKKIRALVFPPLTVEQRICFREVLNSAQEPFDAVSVVRDLWALAKARGLELNSPEQIKTLVRDLPKKVRDRQKDLIVLGRWHPDAVAKLGESYKQNGQTIGMDKIRELNSVVRALDERHPNTLAKLGGERQVTLKLAQMYCDGKFREEGTKSQQAIRAVVKTIRALPVEHEKIFHFFDEQSSWTVLEKVGSDSVSLLPDDLVKACKEFASLLLDVDEPKTLGAKERRALERTATVLNQVLGQN
jgi:hypothetical protein